MSMAWLKWYPTDWRADAGLHQCSLAARGLWVELLGYMHEAEPYGFLLINGKKPTNGEIARLVGAHHHTVTSLVTELVTHGVTGVATDGVLFSRKMVRDHQKALLNRHNGKKGGNPELGKTVNPPVKAQIPEARIQKDSPLPPSGGTRRPKRIPIPPDFTLTAERVRVASDLQLDADALFGKFRRWAEAGGHMQANWDLRWVLWCEEEASRAKRFAGKTNKPKIFAWDEDGRQVTHYGDDGMPRYD